MISKTISEKRGDFKIHAKVIMLGDDLLIVLSGGKEHIGAIAMAEPRPSLDDPKKLSATCSVFTYIGHKEDELSKSISEQLAKELSRKTVIVAGMHWEDLRTADIKLITGICSRITKKIVKEVGK